MTTSEATSATIGAGTAVHVAHFSFGRLTGSLCNPSASMRSRVRLSDRPATCPRCARATTVAGFMATRESKGN